MTKKYPDKLDISKFKKAVLKDQTRVRCRKCGTETYLGFYTWYGCENCKDMNGYEVLA